MHPRSENSRFARLCRKEIVALKFGGTSLLGAARMLHAAELVKPVAQNSNVVVVVSAMKGVTDKLLGSRNFSPTGKIFERALKPNSFFACITMCCANSGSNPPRTIASRANSIRSAAICSMPFPHENPSSHRPNFSIDLHRSANA